jgi:carboxypeptidase PM20D1
MFVLKVLLAVVVLIFMVCFWRFIVFKKKDLPKAQNINEKDALDMAEKLKQMVQIKTLSYRKELNNDQPFVELKSLMKSLFKHVFETMEEIAFPGESILMHWKGKDDQRPIVLMSHLDVVDVDQDAWDEPPFSGHIVNGEIFGRGTLDTKSTVCAFYQACDDLIASGFKPEQDIYLFSSTDEEIQGFGALKAVEYLKDKGVQPFLVLDEGGAIVSGGLPTVSQPLAMVGIVEKGYANIQFVAKSKGGHSSTPPKHTPIARLSAFVNDVEKNFPLKTQMIQEVEDIFKVAAPYMKGINRFLFINMWLFKPLIKWMLPKLSPYGRALLSTTIAFTMMEGSSQENVIPSEASITANLRIHPIQNVEDSYQVLKKLAEKYDVEAHLLKHRNETNMTKTTSKAYAYLSQSIQKAFPDVVTSPYVMLGATDCRHFDQITEGALRFSPIRMNQSELSKMHGHNESIRITTLVEAVQFYKTIIKNHQ